ncbi:MAG: hypothetical protein RL015_3269 [Verrucomicrobiota bacterium]
MVLLHVSKTGVDEVFEICHRGLGVGAFSGEFDGFTTTGGQHHEAHDAFAIHGLVIFLHPDVALVFAGAFNELRGRTGVHAHFIADREFFVDRHSSEAFLTVLT